LLIVFFHMIAGEMIPVNHICLLFRILAISARIDDVHE
jgi:hypothetical protein